MASIQQSHFDLFHLPTQFALDTTAQLRNLSDEGGGNPTGFGVDRPTIRPGETINFKTETKNPPAEATKLAVTFAGGS